MTTCKRCYRNCNNFAICVNIGRADYVLAEHPTNTNTLFYYVIYGSGKLGKMFSNDYITIKEGDFVDVRDTIHDYRTFHSLENFYLIGFNSIEKNERWDGRLIEKHEKTLDLHRLYDNPLPVNYKCFVVCLNGNPLVNGRKFKRYEYSEVIYPNDYQIELNDGVLGFFVRG
tara:strand:+ start:286 stop:798 length:513 start_codon:yes stop_codon:yes gene_type:complete